MKQSDGTTVPMPIDNLLQELKDDIETAKQDGSEMDSRSYGYEEGKILSFNECQMILDYIEKIKKDNPINTEEKITIEVRQLRAILVNAISQCIGEGLIGMADYIKGCLIKNAIVPPSTDDDVDDDDDNFHPCDNCDLPDACSDFGCAIKSGIKKDTGF